MSPPLSHPSCVGTLTSGQENLLDQRLDRLRAATESFSAPAFLEPELMAAFEAHHFARRRRNLVAQWIAPGFALAASLGMSAWMVLSPILRPVPDPGTTAAYTAATAGPFAETPFIALQSLEQIALEPRPQLIETAVPRMWLASFGVSVSPEMAGDSLRAEMLLSATGQPLAMRFLP